MVTNVASCVSPQTISRHLLFQFGILPRTPFDVSVAELTSYRYSSARILSFPRTYPPHALLPISNEVLPPAPSLRTLLIEPCLNAAVDAKVFESLLGGRDMSDRPPRVLEGLGVVKALGYASISILPPVRRLVYTPTIWHVNRCLAEQTDEVCSQLTIALTH